MKPTKLPFLVVMFFLSPVYSSEGGGDLLICYCVKFIQQEKVSSSENWFPDTSPRTEQTPCDDTPGSFPSEQKIIKGSFQRLMDCYRFLSTELKS